MASTCRSTWALGLMLGVALSARASLSQVSGGAGGFGGNAGGSAGTYGGSASTYGSNPSRNPTANERAKREASSGEYAGYGFGGANDRRVPRPAAFLDAGVLMNVRADEYVAVFAVSEEGATTIESNAKMDATLAAFKESLRALGVREEETYTDFVAQVRIYSYKIQDNITSEELVGFELKKNVSIHFRDKALLDKLTQAASRARIYDLVKVDYIVRDTLAIQERLREEAARIIARKAAAHARLLGARLVGPPQVVADKPSIYYPIEQYDSYTAAETEDISTLIEGGRVVRRARKSRTFYFNPLSPSLFDTVINPVVIEPVVQFTAYVRVRYDVGKK